MKNYKLKLSERQQKYQHYQKVDKYEYLTGEEILQPDQRRAIE